MKELNNKPPRTAEYILSLLLSDRELYRLGDYEEIFQHISENESRIKAYRWYWLHTIRSIPELIKNKIYWGTAMFKNYLKIALRNMNRNKSYSIINISGLAVGMACCILILMWVNDELSYDKFHDKAKNIYMLTMTTPNGIWSSSSWALMPTLKKDFPEVVKGTWFLSSKSQTKIKESQYYENWAFVDSDFFEMFTFPLIEGDPKTVLANKNSVVITNKIATKYFGSEDPLGKIINLDNREDLIVTGVLYDIPLNSHLQFDLLAHPSVFSGEERIKTWSADCASYILLHPETNPEEFKSKIKEVYNNYNKQKSVKYYIGIQPFLNIHLYALRGMNPIVYVYIFSLVAVITLLIACINFMNLSTARSAKRAKEIGIRKVIGAERNNLIIQFFSESILFSLSAFILALILIYVSLPFFNELTSKDLSLSFTDNPQLIIGIILIAIMTGILSGTYPAFVLSGFQPVKVLKNSIVTRSKGQGFRRALIITQFVASVVLIISTTIIYKQMKYIQAKDLGFNREQILTIRTNREIRKNNEIIKKELLTNNNITNVTSASSIPLNIGNNNPVHWEGRSSEQKVQMNFACVDYDYFETFDMEMIHGRSFSRDFPTDKENYIINEAALQLTGFKHPIGKKYSMWIYDGKLIGVVKNFHGTSLHNDIRPIVFVMYKNLPYFHMFIKTKTSDIPSTIKHIKSTIEKFAPNFIFEYTFLDDKFNQQYQREERLANILNYFTFLAIFISCLGLFGLASFMAEQKTKEIAVRKVFGASISRIIGLISKEFIILVLIANLIAWPTAYFIMNRWIQNYAYHTNIDLMFFILAGIIAISITILTVSYQAVKAASRNPVDSLKYE